MDRISWKSTFGLALAAMVCLMAAPASAGITYFVTNDLGHQNGWSLDGTITLSGTGTYQTQAEVRGAVQEFDLLFTKGTDFFEIVFPGGSGGFNWLDNLGGFMEATSSTLTLGVGSYFGPQADAGRNMVWRNGYGDTTVYQAGDGGGYWNSPTFNPTTSGGGWIIGSVFPVPEIDPATGSSALSLVAGVLAMIEQRRRRAMLVA